MFSKYLSLNCWAQPALKINIHKLLKNFWSLRQPERILMPPSTHQHLDCKSHVVQRRRVKFVSGSSLYPGNEFGHTLRSQCLAEGKNTLTWSSKKLISTWTIGSLPIDFPEMLGPNYSKKPFVMIIRFQILQKLSFRGFLKRCWNFCLILDLV